jgi:hypothetical protein
MNANINAVLAHIRNGNTNGPVGAVAGLALADAQAGDLDVQDVLDRAEEWASYNTDLADALGGAYASVDEYLAAKDAFETYDDDLAAWNEQKALYDAAIAEMGIDPAVDPIPEDFALLNPGDAPEAVEFDPIAELDSLLETPPDGDAPTEAEVAAAEAVTDAEAAVLALWNKNPDASDEMTDEETALLESLRARFSDADLEAIAEAAGS